MAAASIHAAPLDAFLTANHSAQSFRPEVELGYDMANRTVDFLNLRPKRADGTYGPSGDYSGAHARLGMNLLPSLWIDGGIWSRRLDYVSTAANITSWQLAAQWKAIGDQTTAHSIALRAGAWGDSAPLLRKTTNVVVQGTKFTSAQATNVRDLQIQLDAIASWALADTIELSAFIGGGRSKLDFDRVSATSKTKNGCEFDVQFTDTNVIATCEQNGATTRVSVPNAVYGIDVNREARYGAWYASAGLNGTWTPGDWRLRSGLQFTALDRGAVDAIVISRGGTAYKSNLFALAEIGYKVLPSTLAFVRAQVMAHQFVGEVPLTYNTLTATQHRRRYGILTIGMNHGF